MSAFAPFGAFDVSLSTESLEAIVTRLAAEDRICAVAVATLKSGTLDQTMLVSGCASTQTGSILQAASLSKPMVAYLALKLAERKLLNLDSPVSRYLAHGYAHRQNLFSLKAKPVLDQVPMAVLQRITPRHLLTHSAGFPNWASSGPLSLDFDPGARWQYSGEGYVLLQTVLESITGQPLQQIAVELAFGPLRMQNSSFKLNDIVSGRLVSGAPRQLRFPYEIASSSLYTTARDYALFLAAVLNDESMLAATLAAPVELPRSWGSFLQSTHLSWGLGWGIEVREQPVCIWHWGSNPGFRSLVLADLESRDGVVVLTSSQGGMAAAKSIVSAAVPGDHPALTFDAVQ